MYLNNTFTPCSSRRKVDSSSVDDAAAMMESASLVSTCRRCSWRRWCRSSVIRLSRVKAFFNNLFLICNFKIIIIIIIIDWIIARHMRCCVITYHMSDMTWLDVLLLWHQLKRVVALIHQDEVLNRAKRCEPPCMKWFTSFILFDLPEDQEWRSEGWK